MLLFHGSDHIVDKPVYGKGRSDNDYGRGFYCTEDPDLAREWAVDERRDGYINYYEFDTADINIINLNSEDYCILHWITILLMHRRFELDSPLAIEAYRYLTANFVPDISKTDAIRGYRADDSYFAYAQDFVSGIISVSQLKKAMLLGNLGEQIMIRSKKAFQNVIFTGCEGVSSEEWYQKKLIRDKAARRQYRSMSKDAYVKGELYMIRIIDEEVKPDDPRLR